MIDNLPNANYYVSVASVDGNDVESLFSREILISINGVKDQQAVTQGIELFQNHPNPFDEATTITMFVHQLPRYKTAFILIRDAVSGKEVRRLPLVLKEGINEINYDHGYHASGVYTYTLMVDGQSLGQKKMVFAN